MKQIWMAQLICVIVFLLTFLPAEGREAIKDVGASVNVIGGDSIDMTPSTLPPLVWVTGKVSQILVH